MLVEGSVNRDFSCTALAQLNVFAGEVDLKEKCCVRAGSNPEGVSRRHPFAWRA